MADQRTKQDIVEILKNHLRQAIKSGPTGARNLVFRFADPGDITQQTIPPVQSPQFPGQPPSFVPFRQTPKVPLALGFNPNQVLNTVLSEMSQKKQKNISLQLQNLLAPLLQGRIGRTQFNAGPFIRPAPRGGRPEVGVGFRGRIPF